MEGGADRLKSRSEVSSEIVGRKKEKKKKKEKQRKRKRKRSEMNVG